MPTATALATLMRDACEMLHPDPRFSYISTTTGVGTTTTLVDSGLDYSGADTDLLGQAYVRIDETVTSGPTAGAISRITAAGLTIASGTITVDPAFSATVQSGTDYSIWKLAHPAVARRLFLKRLRLKDREVIFPVSLVADAAMEDTGVTEWTDVGTVTTKAKSTTAAYVRHGSQSLRIVAGAANAGVRNTTNVVCVPNQPWILAVTMRVVSGTWTIIAYDADNSVVIPGCSATNSERAWQTVYFSVSTPSSCRNLQVRITAANSTEECYVDNVILWPQSQREYEPPSWLEDPRNVLDIGYFTLYSSAAGSFLYTPEEGDWKRHGHEPPAFIDEASQHPFRLLLRKPVTYPLYMKALRPFSEPSLDSDTTTADREGLVLLVCSEILEGITRSELENGRLAQMYDAARAALADRSKARLWGSRELGSRARVRSGRWSSY